MEQPSSSRTALVRRARRLLWAGAAAVCFPAAGGAPVQAQVPADPAAVKVAFTFNFAKFTTWPGSKAETGRLRICFERGTLAERAIMRLEGKRLGGRAVAPAVKRPDPERIADCHVLFVGARSWMGERGPLLRQARVHHVLLVSDLTAFARQGGHIGLETTGGRMRFSVNLAAARRAGLSLSSRMLRLARVVQR